MVKIFSSEKGNVVENFFLVLLNEVPATLQLLVLLLLRKTLLFSLFVDVRANHITVGDGRYLSIERRAPSCWHDC